MKRIAKTIGSLAISGLVFLVMLEAGCFIAVKAGWLDVELPGYSFDESNWFWKITNADVGVWHEPNDTMHHEKQCFDVTYTSNAFGMRDKDVPMESKERRVVVLGDSFVEGWGVKDAARFTNVLEHRFGIGHLNFGTSGGFGSTQSYVLYKTLGSRFSHDAVIFAVLPDNDFADDTPSEEDLGPNGRWRPFLVGTYPDYTLTYPARDFSPDRRIHRSFQVLMSEFWITSRVFTYYSAYFRELEKQKKLKTGADGSGEDDNYFSGYFDYGAEQFGRLKYAIERIKEIAGTRPVLVVTIPRPADYRRVTETNSEPPIRRDLRALSDTLGITYIDLMTGMPQDENLARYFHECDGHWSEQGHAKVAEIVGGWRYFTPQSK